MPVREEVMEGVGREVEKNRKVRKVKKDPMKKALRLMIRVEMLLVEVVVGREQREEWAPTYWPPCPTGARGSLVGPGINPACPNVTYYKPPQPELPHPTPGGCQLGPEVTGCRSIRVRWHPEVDYNSR